HHHLGIGGSAHAGRRPLADADGEGGRDSVAALRATHPLRLDSHQSHNRRRERQLLDAWRRNSRRTGGGHWFRRTARDQADDRTGAARRIPDRGVPARARNRRFSGGACGAEENRWSTASSHERQTRFGRVDDVLTSYKEAISSLFARTTGGIKPGLERTEAL